MTKQYIRISLPVDGCLDSDINRTKLIEQLPFDSSSDINLKVFIHADDQQGFFPAIQMANNKKYDPIFITFGKFITELADTLPHKNTFIRGDKLLLEDAFLGENNYQRIESHLPGTSFKHAQDWNGERNSLEYQTSLNIHKQIKNKHPIEILYAQMHKTAQELSKENPETIDFRFIDTDKDRPKKLFEFYNKNKNCIPTNIKLSFLYYDKNIIIPDDDLPTLQGEGKVDNDYLLTVKEKIKSDILIEQLLALKYDLKLLNNLQFDEVERLIKLTTVRNDIKKIQKDEIFIKEKNKLKDYLTDLNEAIMQIIQKNHKKYHHIESLYENAQTHLKLCQIADRLHNLAENFKDHDHFTDLQELELEIHKDLKIIALSKIQEPRKNWHEKINDLDNAVTATENFIKDMKVLSKNSSSETETISAKINHYKKDMQILSTKQEMPIINKIYNFGLFLVSDTIGFIIGGTFGAIAGGAGGFIAGSAIPGFGNLTGLCIGAGAGALGGGIIGGAYIGSQHLKNFGLFGANEHQIATGKIVKAMGNLAHRFKPY
jgi:hypothetical protein